MMESIFDEGSAQWQDHGILYGPGETANNFVSLYGVHDIRQRCWLFMRVVIIKVPLFTYICSAEQMRQNLKSILGSRFNFKPTLILVI